MKYIFFILLLIGVAAMLPKCKVEKEIQVKEIVATLIKIKSASRENGVEMRWLTWRGDNKIDYAQLCVCPYAKLGDSRILLVTR